MADNEIFRKVALDRLSSPEQLDELMEVTTSKAWMALATMAVLILLLLVWSFTGSLPTKIHATGILLKQGGVADISATAGGQVTDVHGTPLDFTTGPTLKRNAGIIASNGPFHEKVIAAVQEVVSSPEGN